MLIADHIQTWPSDKAAKRGSILTADIVELAGSLGGIVTTVEGLLDTVIQQLQKTHSFSLGDSAQGVTRSQWSTFIQKLDDCMTLKHPWTLQLSDPLANTFISSVTSDPAEDARLSTEDYERSAEEDEHLGISHLKEHAGEGETL